jgi:MFS transporter, Spinster family, sphingosine-1-phosphate transporter
MPVLCQIARPHLRATGYGIFYFAGCLAGGLVAPVAGALKAGIGLGGSLQTVAIVLLFSVILLLRIRVPGSLEPWAASPSAALIGEEVNEQSNDS